MTRRVLVACEFSGVVRRALRSRGVDAWSCDLGAAEDDDPHHIQGDVLPHLTDGWDAMIAHPECTYLAVSGARWMRYRPRAIEAALDFVIKLMEAPIAKICIENPVSIISTRIRKPDEIISPREFGHAAHKKTCLWLKNFPILQPTEWIPYDKCVNEIHLMGPCLNRGKERSRTYSGIAEAMAAQWF
jgi:hypothetical protein